MRSLVHPRLLDRIAPAFFPDRCTIEASTPSRSGSGYTTSTWLPLSGHSDIPCAVSPMIFTRVGESEGPTITSSETTHRIGLAGAFPTVTAAHRLVVAQGPHAGVYDILRPDLDSQSGMTVLEAKIATPVAVAGV